MITYGGVTEIFYMADDFCKFFDVMTANKGGKTKCVNTIVGAT